MKVLILADGSSIHSSRILEWHLSQGCEVVFVDYVNPRPNGCSRFSFVKYPGLRGATLLRKIVGRKAAVRLDAIAGSLILRRIWKRVRPDIVHLYQVDARAHHCALAAIKPLVLSCWGTDINQHFVTGADKGYRQRTGSALASADLIIADAVDILERCEQLAGNSIPTELLPVGVNTQMFRPGYREEASVWRDQLGIPKEAYVLFSMRALTPLYGHHHILEAFALALPQFRRSAALVFKIYNNEATREYEHSLRQQADRLGILKHIYWSPQVAFEELPVLYAAADAIVNYPLMDGFPVTFVEAAACERTVITNRLPSYTGTFAEKYFTMTESESPVALASALSSAVNAAPTRLAETDLQNARLLIEAEYSESRCAQRLTGFYGRLIGSALFSREKNSRVKSFKQV